MSDAVGFQLLAAARDGHISEVSSLLRDNPGFNINWGNDEGWTALHVASLNGQAEVVKLLLARPRIDVTKKELFGNTPILLSCDEGHISVVRLLLKDPRVDVALGNRGRTPLWYASRKGHREVVEWFIESGRELGDIKNEKGRNGRDGKDYTSLEIARDEGETEVVSLLERLIANPALTRHELRLKLGMLDELAAAVFALTVFLCDELLQLKPAPLDSPDTAAHATRFFAIAERLPMELQMIMCHCAVGSTKQNILRKDSEAAFKSLTRIVLSSPP